METGEFIADSLRECGNNIIERCSTCDELGVRYTTGAVVGVVVGAAPIRRRRVVVVVIVGVVIVVVVAFAFFTAVVVGLIAVRACVTVFVRACVRAMCVL